MLKRNQGTGSGTAAGQTPSLSAWVLARLVRGQPVDVALVDPTDPFFDVVQRVMSANGAGSMAAFEAALDDVPNGDDLVRLVLAIDPDDPPPSPAARTRQAEYPDLPVAACPDPQLAAAAGGWIDDYVRYAQSISPMTPPLFHQSAGLWLGSAAIARRLAVPLPHDNAFPNLSVLWVAPTTIFRKSTALNVARRLVANAFPHLLLPQEMTPEALQSDLGGQPPTKLDGLPEMEQARWRQSRDFAAQRALAYDELSGLLAAAGRDYAAGLIETLLRLIDCEEHFVRSTRSQGRVAIQNAYLSILGASTPRAMGPHLGAERLWAMGWWPRFAILTPQVTKPAWAQPTTDGPPSEDLLRPLRNLYQRLPTPTWPEPAKYRAVTLGPGVFDA